MYIINIGAKWVVGILSGRMVLALTVALVKLGTKHRLSKKSSYYHPTYLPTCMYVLDEIDGRGYE